MLPLQPLFIGQQAVPQDLGRLGGQLHEPPRQTEPIAHFWLQPPQWLTFVLVSTQAPLQMVSGGVHRTWQVPIRQVRPVPQRLPQEPQFMASFCRFRHWPLQLTWLAGQQMPALQRPPSQGTDPRLVQVNPGAAHSRQGPAQGPVQQRPATQAFDLQSLLATQGSPGSPFSGATQRPSIHTCAPMQGVSRVSQPPPSLHTRLLTLPLLQPEPPQEVPGFSRRQAPAPSQPFEQASSRQVPLGSAPPTGTSEQTPSLPLSAHERQVPPQALLQQRPCAQKLLTHSLALLHTAPSGRLPQSPPEQTLPPAHWLSLPQLVRQRPPLQPRKGAQERAPGVRQSPLLQVPAGVSVLSSPSQLGSRQTVPFL
jgi:hypothetical protein